MPTGTKFCTISRASATGRSRTAFASRRRPAGSAPNAAALAAIPQSAAYYGFGVTTLYYTPPTHASQYYLNVKVLADGVALPGAGRDVLVTPSRPVDAMKTIALDRTLRPINAAAAVRGAVANEAFKMLIEARDDNGAPLGASAASFVRVSVTPLVVAGSAAYATHRTELTSEGRVAVYVTATVAGEYSVYVEVNVAGSWQALGGKLGGVHRRRPRERSSRRRRG